MLFKAATAVDRYSAAHEHFGSAGMDIKKIIVLAVIALIIVGLIIYSFKKND